MRRDSVFYSFHYKNDVFRVWQIRKIGSLDGNEPVITNEWEKLKLLGEKAVKNWIDQTLKYKNALIVLVGLETASRPLVQYEIKKAWNDGKAVLGIYIHNINCMKTGTCMQGENPFRYFDLDDGSNFANVVKCYNPNSDDAYKDIAGNISSWIDEAKRIRAQYS